MSAARSAARRRVGWTQAAAFALAACAVCSASDSRTLTNGLSLSWEAGGPYEAVALTVACPEPRAPAALALPLVLEETLDAALRVGGGAAERAAALGGTLSVEYRGGTLTALALGPEGSASDLVELVASLAGGAPATRELLDRGGLDDALMRRIDAGLDPREELGRALFGAAWQPGPEDLDRAVASLSAERVDELRRAWFRGGRCFAAVVATAPTPTPEALAALEALPAGQSARVWAPAPRSPRPARLGWEGVGGQSAVSHAARGPAPESVEAAAWTVASYLLGRGNGGRLFRRLRAERGLCYAVSCRWLPEDGGMLWIEALCDPGDEDLLEEGLNEVLRELAETLPTEAEMERARGLAFTDWTALLRSPERMARVRALGMARGGAADWAERHLEALKGVDAQDIRRVGETMRAHGVRLRIESR